MCLAVERLAEVKGLGAIGPAPGNGQVDCMPE
jgi:hypothetical protein